MSRLLDSGSQLKQGDKYKVNSQISIQKLGLLPAVDVCTDPLDAEEFLLESKIS